MKKVKLILSLKGIHDDTFYFAGLIPNDKDFDAEYKQFLMDNEKGDDESYYIIDAIVD